MDENVYDAIGLNVAYNVLHFLLTEENAKKLPDMEDLSDDQMFFISFAMV